VLYYFKRFKYHTFYDSLHNEDAHTYIKSKSAKDGKAAEKALQDATKITTSPLLMVDQSLD
jgi:hypothetical protein